MGRGRGSRRRRCRREAEGAAQLIRGPAFAQPQPVWRVRGVQRSSRLHVGWLRAISRKRCDDAGSPWLQKSVGCFAEPVTCRRVRRRGIAVRLSRRRRLAWLIATNRPWRGAEPMFRMVHAAVHAGHSLIGACRADTWGRLRSVTELLVQAPTFPREEGGKKDPSRRFCRRSRFHFISAGPGSRASLE